MYFRVFLLIVLVAVGAVAAAPMAAAQPTQPDSDALAGAPEEIDADETRLDISVQSDGSADWSVEYWVRLDDNESVDAFESITDDIDEDPEPYTTQFADRIDDTVATASAATDREMSAEAFTVETSRQSLGAEYGVVRYAFQWNGFAATDSDELHAGDAIEGLYLDDETRLSISWPDEYELVSVTPDPDDHRDRAVIWQGSETDFVSDEPRVVVSAGGSGIGTMAIGAATFVVAIGIGAAWWYRTRSSTTTPADDDSDQSASGASSGDVASTAPQTGSEPDPRDDLLSNEEQVLHLLEEYDGRMKQQAVVEELEWTDAKTSKVVSTLREQGDLESFRLGRENVLSLPTDDDDEGNTKREQKRTG